MEKGYIQFRCDHEPAAPPAGAAAMELCRWRDRLRHIGLVGVGADGIGFGNLSLRRGNGPAFLITGTATGAIESLCPDQLTEVLAWDLAGNHVTCRGPAVASSETLSHAAAYESDGRIGAVIHVHHTGAWHRLLRRAPTTDAAAEAGTPAMGLAIQKLLRDRPDTTGPFLIVMGGHPDGLLAVGQDLDDAARTVLDALDP
jgi:L-ribulose-5-phosphate 4-epimerase